MKNKLIQGEEFDIKESFGFNKPSPGRRKDVMKLYYLLLCFILYFVKHLSVILEHFITSFLSPDDGLLKPKRYNVDFL